MWSHPKLKKKYAGNYETKNGVRKLLLEYHNGDGKKIGKVYPFSSWQAAKKAGWKHT